MELWNTNPVLLRLGGEKKRILCLYFFPNKYWEVFSDTSTLCEVPSSAQPYTLNSTFVEIHIYVDKIN